VITLAPRATFTNQFNRDRVGLSVGLSFGRYGGCREAINVRDCMTNRASRDNARRRDSAREIAGVTLLSIGDRIEAARILADARRRVNDDNNERSSEHAIRREGEPPKSRRGGRRVAGKKQ